MHIEHAKCYRKYEYFFMFIGPMFKPYMYLVKIDNYSTVTKNNMIK